MDNSPQNIRGYTDYFLQCIGNFYRANISATISVYEGVVLSLPSWGPVSGQPGGLSRDHYKNFVGQKFKYAVFDIKTTSIITMFSSQMINYTQQKFVWETAVGTRPPMTGKRGPSESFSP